MKKNNKNLTLKILFILSFVTPVGIILSSIWSAIFGVTFIFNKVYGIEAFELTIFVLSLYLSPLLIVSLIYQMIYIIRKRILKKTSY